MKTKLFEMLKQRRIDGGQLGGAYTIFNNSQSILALINFVQVTMITYIMVFKPWISIPLFVIAFALIYGTWMAIYYIYLMPSIIVFNNRQNFTIERNPVNQELALIRRDIEELKEIVKEVKKQ